MTPGQYTVALSSSADETPGKPIRGEVSYAGYQRVVASFVERDEWLVNEAEITFPTALEDAERRTYVLSACLLEGETVVANALLEFPITVSDRVAPQFRAEAAWFSVEVR